jgi:hypothetical protein
MTSPIKIPREFSKELYKLTLKFQMRFQRSKNSHQISEQYKWITSLYDRALPFIYQVFLQSYSFKGRETNSPKNRTETLETESQSMRLEPMRGWKWCCSPGPSTSPTEQRHLRILRTYEGWSFDMCRWWVGGWVGGCVCVCVCVC